MKGDESLKDFTQKANPSVEWNDARPISRKKEETARVPWRKSRKLITECRADRWHGAATARSDRLHGNTAGCRTLRQNTMAFERVLVSHFSPPQAEANHLLDQHTDQVLCIASRLGPCMGHHCPAEVVRAAACSIHFSLTCSRRLPDVMTLSRFLPGARPSTDHGWT